MYRLFKVINDFKNYLTFVILVIISLSLISISTSTEIGGFRTIIISAIGLIQESFAWLPNPGALRSENKALVELNLQLSTEVAVMRKSQQENEELRAMLLLSKKSELPLIPAEVVSKNTVQMRNYIMIDKGLNDSIAVGMSVRSEAGLAGSVIGISHDYAIIELLNNRNVKIPAKLSEAGYEGIVVWEGDENLYLKNISNSLEITIGDVVTTSLFSNKYPHNIPIGKVVKVEEEPGSHFHKIYIKPASRFFGFNQVFVIKMQPDPQKQLLIKDIENKFELLDKKRR